LNLSERALAVLARARVAHLATADQYARPHVVPIVFVYEDRTLFTPIDRKPKSVSDWRELRRVRNIEANGRVSVVIDEYDEDWSRLAWVRFDGIAEVLTTGSERERAVGLLTQKYAQYQAMSLEGAPVVCVHIERASSWSAG
jgi:PPOX class probable F420-dependent enzyme